MGDNNLIHHDDWNAKTYCLFKHIPSTEAGKRIARNIEVLMEAKSFDKDGLESCGRTGNGSRQIILTRKQANAVRDELDKILANEFYSVWFTIQSDPLHSLINRTLADTSTVVARPSAYKVSCQFGSLRSYDKFYSHTSFNNEVLEVKFRNVRRKPDSLCIKLNENQRIIISIDSIQKRNILVKKSKSDREVFVLLPLKYAPHIFEDVYDEKGQSRQMRLCNDENSSEMINTIGLSSDLVLHFPPKQSLAWFFLTDLMAYGPERFEINYSSFKTTDWSDEKNKHKTPDPFDYKNASFKDRYALQMLTSLGYVFRDKWAHSTDQDLKWNEWKENERYSLCCYAAEQLRNDHGYDLRRTARDYNESRKELAGAKSDKDEQSMSIDRKQQLEVAVCRLSPLRLVFERLEVTTGSRALRNEQFGGPEHFLLVHFRDEDNRELRVSNENIKKQLGNKMLNGIKSLGRTFKYLGASTGQMKEMGFWFIDLPKNIKDMMEAHKILGDFSGIKNIATYIARVGQYFSTTWPIGIRLTKVKSEKDIRRNSDQYYILEIDDIERNKKCFTDGIGKISWGLAGRVAHRMGIPLFSKEGIPSAFQVRIAGCKGMVAIDPNSTLNDYYIHYRHSMEKFLSEDWNLEICEFSRPMPLAFNNQVIRLLSDLGNPDAAFDTFQTLGLKQWRVPEEQQQSMIDIALNKNASYATAKDNLLKNRIPVPHKDGRNMFGVADETGELEYGQCFIQYSLLESQNNNQRRFQVVTGPVLVTKNPCMWPGDFRRLTAVRNKKLEECMRDVIVFPVNGARPHPNEISGSDLDGDQYWVYWGEDLKIEKPAEPLSYDSAKKAEVSLIDQTVIVNHIVETFGAGGVVGMIANTHTALADQQNKHSFSEPCKELAELFSIAIDSAKTGIIVHKHEIERFQKMCKGWPHFMLKLDQKPYESKSVLEKLFFAAKNKYFELQVAPMIDTFPQKKKAVKGATANEIKDEGFKKWLDGKDYEEKENKKEPQRKKSIEPETKFIPIDAPPPKQKKGSKPPITTDENPNPEVKKLTTKKTEKNEPRPESAVQPKLDKTLSTENQILPKISTAATSNVSITAPSLAGIDQCQLDFLMAVSTRTTIASGIEFSPVVGSLFTANLSKGSSETSNKGEIIEKLTSHMEKQNVFKKRSSDYNETTHGPLYSMIFYGCIYFTEQNSLPQKFGELQQYIIKNHDQFIRFHYADSKKLDISRNASSITSKTLMIYEFDCVVSSNPSQYITLLYNSTKALRKVRVNHIWSKCYVRQPNLNTDILYEIRSGITYESGSSEFVTIVSSVFKSPQATELLKDRRPNIQIERNLLQSSVTPISLKIIDQDRQTRYVKPPIESFYREVTYVSISEQPEKPKPLSTIEYHVSPISKDEDIFKSICDMALSPTEE